MQCKCGGKTHVTDTRVTATGNPWRRRQCLVCLEIITTVEIETDSTPVSATSSKVLREKLDRASNDRRNKITQVAVEQRLSSRRLVDTLHEDKQSARNRIEDMKLKKLLDDSMS